MKTFNFSLLTLVATLLLTLMSCNGDDSPSVNNEKKIVGVWELTNYGYGMSSNWRYIRFDANGKGYYGGRLEEVQNPTLEEEEIIWSFTESGNTLVVRNVTGYYTYAFEDFEFLQNGDWKGVDEGTLYIYSKIQ